MAELQPCFCCIQLGIRHSAQLHTPHATTRHRSQSPPIDNEVSFLLFLHNTHDDGDGERGVTSTHII